MKIVTTNGLSEDAKQIRESVFVDEQGFSVEFDDTDAIANSMVLYTDDGRPIACCRYYEDEQKGTYWIGRLAVRREYRGNHIGENLLLAAEEEIRQHGGQKICVSAQKRVKHFYEKQNYESSGAVYYDEFCAHIHMEKTL